MNLPDQPVNPFSDQPANPYLATATQVAHGAQRSPVYSGLVNQVAIVGILQIVFGLMELAMGVFLVFYAFLFSVIMPGMNNGAAAPPPPELIFGLSIGFGIGGSIVLLFSILRVITGILCFWFKNRTLTLVSLIGGLVTSLTCYCSPFSIGIGVYGMVVMFDAAVRHAYQLSAEGVSAEEVRARFARARYGT
ncbi:MAG: hypothetical protein NTY15_14180 [Planctomycetota bacterium]|nr:hypothetical protein [Planctomycetota bacterium]